MKTIYLASIDKDTMMSYLKHQLQDLEIEKEFLEANLKLIKMERELINKNKEDYDNKEYLEE